MAPTPIGVDAVTAIVDRYVMPEIVDGVYNSNVILHRIYNAKKVNRQGGTQIEIPVLYKRGTSGGWYRGLDRLTLAQQDNIKNFAFGWKQLYQTVTIDGLTLIITDSPEAIANHISLQVEQAKMDMMEDLAVGLFGAGGGASGGDPKSMDGLGALIDDGTDVTVYGGITRSGNAFAKAKLDASTSTLSLFSLRQAVGSVTIGGNSPTIIVSRQEQYDRYWKLIQQVSSVNIGTTGAGAGFRDETLGAFGFHNLLFDGIPWCVDSHVSDGANSSNSDILFINENFLHLYVSPRADLYMEEFQTPADMDAITGKLLWAGNLACGAPRLHAKMTAVTG